MICHLTFSSFIWDSENSSFIQYSPADHPSGSCESCEKICQQELLDSNDAVKCTPSKLTLKSGTEYHVNDFVYISDNNDCLYTIGQLLKFSGSDSSGRWKAQVLLFGRFDDVARLEDNQAQDEVCFHVYGFFIVKTTKHAYREDYFKRMRSFGFRRQHFKGNAGSPTTMRSTMNTA